MFADAQVAGTNYIVPQLCFGLINDTNDNDVNISGLLGLGFPLLSGFWRQLPTTYTQSQIAPLVVRLFDAGQIPANVCSPFRCLQLNGSKSGSQLYSLIFDREGYASANGVQNVTANGGSMTIGGYPAGMSEASFNFVNVPIIDIAEDAPRAEQFGFPPYAG